MKGVHFQVEIKIKFLRFWIFNFLFICVPNTNIGKNNFVNDTPHISSLHATKDFMCQKNNVYYVIKNVKVVGTDICDGYLRGC